MSKLRGEVFASTLRRQSEKKREHAQSEEQKHPRYEAVQACAVGRQRSPTHLAAVARRFLAKSNLYDVLSKKFLGRSNFKNGSYHLGGAAANAAITQLVETLRPDW